MLKQIWQGLIGEEEHSTSIDKKKEKSVKLPPLSDKEYQKLFFRLLAGISQDWGQTQVLRHLGDRVNDRFFLAWLREYRRSSQQNIQENKQLGLQLLKLSQSTGGEIGEIIADLSKDYLQSPQKKLVEIT